MPGRLELYAQNLTNVIKSTFTSNSQFALQETITRPRVLGLSSGTNSERSWREHQETRGRRSEDRKEADMEQNAPRKVALVANCLLNQNAKVCQGANYRGVVSPVVEALRAPRLSAAAAALP